MILVSLSSAVLFFTQTYELWREMIGKPAANISQPSNTIATAKSSASPDIITLTDCIATLFRAARYEKMDEVFAEAVNNGIILRGNRLDSHWETDLSGMSIPVASAASRYILHQIRYVELKDLNDVSFITGVGTFQQKERSKSGASKESRMSLRDYLQSMLLEMFELESYIPARAKGTVVVKKEALTQWLEQFRSPTQISTL